MDIEFPNVETWDGDTFVVSFPAVVDGEKKRCAISWEALQDHFGGSKVHALNCFKSNRRRIEEMAERKIRKGKFEVDGTVVVRNSDFS
jgi:hypothetical protein